MNFLLFVSYQGIKVKVKPNTINADEAYVQYLVNPETELAEKIVQIASEKNIHIEENIPLVDLLDVQEVGESVPEETWIALSKIFAFVLENSKKVGE